MYVNVHSPDDEAVVGEDRAKGVEAECHAGEVGSNEDHAKEQEAGGFGASN